MTDQLRAVRFQRAMAPYEAMDVAGFAPAKAQDLVDRSIAEFWPAVAPAPVPAAAVPVTDVLTGMDRAALLAYAKEHLGAADEPPATVADDALRAVIRGAVNPEMLAPKKLSKK